MSPVQLKLADIPCWHLTNWSSSSHLSSDCVRMGSHTELITLGYYCPQIMIFKIGFFNWKYCAYFWLESVTTKEILQDERPNFRSSCFLLYSNNITLNIRKRSDFPQLSRIHSTICSVAFVMNTEISNPCIRGLYPRHSHAKFITHCRGTDFYVFLEVFALPPFHDPSMEFHMLGPFFMLWEVV